MEWGGGRKRGRAPLAPSLEARTSEPIDISPSILLLCAHVCAHAGRYTRAERQYLSLLSTKYGKEKRWGGEGQERHDKQRKEKKLEVVLCRYSRIFARPPGPPIAKTSQKIF